MAIGFSVITCRPAAATCTAWSAWMPAGRGEDHDVGVGARQHRVQRLEARGRPVRSTAWASAVGVHVAHADQLGPVGVLVQGVEVVGGDPAAAREGEPDLAVS